MSENRLDETSVDRDPIAQLRAWLDDAIRAGIGNAEAMALATATPAALPSVRFVLLRGLDERGLVFFTNYESRKALELEANPNAALALYWDALGRQVRATGAIARASREESEAYFSHRPAGSRLGAWASPQSRVIGSRDELESLLTEVEKRFGDGDPPVPPFWGGYRLTPDTVEFWEHRESRLHDRVLYTRRSEGGWRIERLAP